MMRVFLLFAFLGALPCLGIASHVEFKYGADSLNSYLSSVDLYPAFKNAPSDGSVIVTFWSDQEGRLSSYGIERGMGEAINVDVIKAIHTTDGMWEWTSDDRSKPLTQVQLEVEFQVFAESDIQRGAEPIEYDHPVVKIYLIGVSFTNSGVRGRMPMDFYESDEEAYFAYGMEHYEREEYGQAIAKFKQAIALNKKNSEALYYRGLCWHMQSLKTKACKDIRKAADLGHEAAKAWLNENCK